MNSLVSIIIPTYNRANLIGETLDSILAQTYGKWECIIVDDGSTDNTTEIVGKYIAKDSRFQYHNRPLNRLAGGNAARNYGFELSQGEYVNWLDSDDIMDKDCIEKKISFLAFNPKTEAIITNIRYSNYQFTSFRESKYQLLNDVQSLLFLYATDQIELQVSVFLWERTFLANKPLFDEKMQRYQDNEFHIRMIVQLNTFIMKLDVLATIRGGNGNESQISSLANSSHKKFVDIYKYRYASLKLFNFIPEKIKNEYIAIVSNKTIWSFHLALKSNAKFIGRIIVFYENRKLIQETLRFKEVFFYNRIKSYLYLVKIVIFR